MSEESALIVIAEVAAALAGFSGIAATLGRRGGTALSKGDRARLSDLLAHSGIALFASLAPLVMAQRVGFDEPVLWVVSSGLWAFFATIGIAQTCISMFRDPTSSRLVRRVVVLAAFIALLLLQMGNALAWQQSWPYLLALVGNLGFAFVQFMGLVNPMLRGR